MALAVTEYKLWNPPGKAAHHGCGLRSIASDYSVSYTTLRARVRGVSIIAEFNRASKRHTTDAEEDLLLKFALVSADRGFALRCEGLQQVAQALVASRNADVVIGKNWVDHFVQHHEELKKHWTHKLAKVCNTYFFTVRVSLLLL